MSQFTIQTVDDLFAFEPGAEVSGSISWKVEAPIQAIELRLFWFTRGKGTEDAAVIDKMRLDQPSAAGTEKFRFKLPDAPYSFSGKLISLIWGLELVAQPSREVARVELTVAPGAREVRLDTVPEHPIRMRLFGQSAALPK